MKESDCHGTLAMGGVLFDRLDDDNLILPRDTLGLPAGGILLHYFLGPADLVRPGRPGKGRTIQHKVNRL